MKHRAAYSGLQAVRPDPVPVERLLLGRPVTEAVELLPRLFNLCAAAQRVGIRMALGLAVTDQDLAGLYDDIRRSHALQLGVILPRALGLPAHPAPLDLLETPDLGEQSLDDLMTRDSHLGRLLRALDRRFPPGIAVTSVLQTPTHETLFAHTAIENSVAAHHASALVMRHVEARSGRGPLWRVLGLVLGLPPAVCLPPIKPRQGAVIVPAARGQYAIEARAEEGRLTAFRRVTPTDHMLVPSGALDQALANCPAQDAPLLLRIFDPCQPVTLRETAHA